MDSCWVFPFVNVNQTCDSRCLKTLLMQSSSQCIVVAQVKQILSNKKKTLENIKRKEERARILFAEQREVIFEKETNMK